MKSPHVSGGCFGYTLIEVTVGLSVTASVLLLAVQLLHQSFRLSSRVSESQNEMRSFTGFAETFRHDVAHAEISADGSPNRIELSVDNGQRVVYEAHEDRVSRRSFAGLDQQQQGQLRLSSDHQAIFLVDENPHRITLRIGSRVNVPIDGGVVKSQTTAVLGIRRGASLLERGE